MQEVSNQWKEQHNNTLLNESFVEVSLNISDPIALGVAEARDNGAIYISDSSQITDGVDNTPPPYCTLEQNLWCLDGNRKALGEGDVGNNSYIGTELSDDTCIYRRHPIVTIDFPRVFTKLIPGVTITWSKTYGEFADIFSVVAYNGEAIVAEKEITDNRSITSIIFVDIDNYDRIDIIVKKWCLPYRRARIEEIIVGLTKVYYKGDLFGYSHSQSVDPVSTSLPKNEIKFSIDNLDGEYNPHNPKGLAQYLMERQEIKVRYGLKMDDSSVEWIKGGTFYLSEWYAKQNAITAEFTARDVLEFMSNVRPAETTKPSSSRNLYDLANTLLTEANIPTTWVITEELEKITTSAPLPEDTYGNLLQLIANAGECVIYQDREGVLHIARLTEKATDYKINSFNSYSKPEITLSKPIKEVRVKVFSYSNATDSTSSEVSNTVGGEGEIITVNNPLVTDTSRATSLASWLSTHLGHRASLDSSWRVDVRLDALDIVNNENTYTSNKVRITDLVFKYNGAFTGTSKGKVI
jgi:hypothetical protein